MRDAQSTENNGVLHTVLTARRKPILSGYVDPGDDWLPKYAEFEVSTAAGAPGQWFAVELDLTSGPHDLYDYFPFTSFIYVDGRLDTIAEFSDANETVRVQIRMPAGRSVTVAIATELGRVPAENGSGADARELAILFGGFHLEHAVPALQFRSSQLEPKDAHYKNRLSPLLRNPPRPIFVMGPYRSGTSILTWALGQHPNIWPLEETGWIPFLAGGGLAGYRAASRAARSFFHVYGVEIDEYMAYIGSTVDQFLKTVSRRNATAVSLGRLSGTPISAHYDPRFQYFRSLFNPKERWVDGTPENANHIRLLRSLFPGARFICMVRNPEHVVKSMTRFDIAGGRPQDFAEAAAMWSSMTRACLTGARAYGRNVFKILQYETMIAQPEATLREVFDFLGEAQFAKSAETFGKRINSSRLNETVPEPVLPGDFAPTLSNDIWDQYEAALSFRGADEPDQEADRDLQERENDFIERTLAAFS